MSRGRILAAEAAVGAILAGIFAGGAASVGIAVLGGLVLVAAVARWRGRWVVDRLRDPVPAALPSLHVVESVHRNGPPVGIAGDGQGFVAALRVAADLPVRLDLDVLTADAAADRAGLAAVQVLVEQFPVPPLDVASGFAPTVAYRQLPTSGIPVARRVWILLRHEPVWAVDAVRKRGGGAVGARVALTGAVARLGLRLASRGVPTRALGEPELRDVLGDAVPAGEAKTGVWVTPGGWHCCLVGAGEVDRLLAAAASVAAERTLVSVVVDLAGPVTRCAVRMVAAGADQAAYAYQQMISTGLVEPMGDDQVAGMLATLPLGGGPRSLVSAIRPGRAHD